MLLLVLRLGGGWAMCVDIYARRSGGVHVPVTSVRRGRRPLRTMSGVSPDTVEISSKFIANCVLFMGAENDVSESRDSIA